MQFYDEDERSPRRRKGSNVPVIIFVAIFILGIVGYMVVSRTRVIGQVGQMMAEEVENEDAGCDVEVTAVIDHNESSRDEGSYTYAPVYRFEYEGTTYNVRGKVWESKPVYEEGQEVNIMIDSSDPYHIYDPGNNLGTALRSFGISALPFFAVFALMSIVPVVIIIVLIAVVVKNSKSVPRDTYEE